MTYKLPAEWHEQSAIQLTWPHAKTDWQPWLAEIESTYVDIVNAITQFQPVVIACHDISVEQAVNDRCSSLCASKMVKTFIAPCNDTWARDHGPITLVNEAGETKVLDFTFNAWGAKYDANLDDQINLHLIQQPFVNLQQYQNVDFVLEGGSIESDGRGSLLTTEICLLNKNRNDQLSKQQIEDALKEVFHLEKVIWLSQGHLPGDDTDAHIDTLARFTPKGITYVTCDDPTADAYSALKTMEQELKDATDAQGKSYTLFPLPSPKPIYNDEGEPLPATYANFLIINGAVLVPTYGDNQDQVAMDIIQSAFPEHKIIAINCRTVIEQYGSLHCLTMQLPKGLIHV
ncbi:agmatine deiminase family protein [Psychrosphaera sp. B3R10]|uniref:agmatine deiminase family protein n=1 Tax=unclassified Psychrosphaera TaxID=2641570 RepID=UPI001C0A5101|nr:MULTISPECIES: agmatine deiminase family protein [unclassified Psychrosphaera]MBU2881345.1 agmatine deiminase family protein [Psychrosphaera sp. I2R16]MBU2988444.1 agmatine deiminase family protein [Psychrosphaera sp. B3R10]